MNNETADPNLLGMTSKIVAAFVSNNSIPSTEVGALVEHVHKSLRRCATGSTVEGEAVPAREPAVAIKRSVTDDYIVCLEDGKKFKSLKRHLMSHYNMTPEEYREKWKLPTDYPMVAPNYAAARSRLAKQMGLGRKAGNGRKPGKAAA